MRLAVNKLSALRILRRLRADRVSALGRRCDLPSPDPSPYRRWTRGRLPLDRLALPAPPSRERRLSIAVPCAEDRVQASFAACTVYSAGLPPRAFVDVGGGIAISSPELLFLELATIMSPPVHALLGLELCGTFSRDPLDPRNGEVTFDVRPVTTVRALGAFLDACPRGRAVDAARRTLARIDDDCWSPMEATIAALTALPFVELGYELGAVDLNVRRPNDPTLVAMGCRESRVPDVEIRGSRVGFNYDGHAHLDLEAVVGAAAGGDAEPARALARQVRDKYLDDLRRNRELAAGGRVILPVTSEDLFAEGGLDAVMLEAALAREALDGVSADPLRSALGIRVLTTERQQLIWSMLPWNEAERYGRELVERMRAFCTEPVVEDAEICF